MMARHLSLLAPALVLLLLQPGCSDSTASMDPEQASDEASEAQQADDETASADDADDTPADDTPADMATTGAQDGAGENAGGADSSPGGGSTNGDGDDTPATNTDSEEGNGDVPDASVDPPEEVVPDPADAGAAQPGPGVTCRPDRALCRRLPPSCREGQVPSVEGSCWGDCVPVQDCDCREADDCPQPEKFTCWTGPGYCNYYGP